MKEVSIMIANSDALKSSAVFRLYYTQRSEKAK